MSRNENNNGFFKGCLSWLDLVCTDLPIYVTSCGLPRPPSEAISIVYLTDLLGIVGLAGIPTCAAVSLVPLQRQNRQA